MLEDGSAAELAPHRWWAEGEQRGCQTTAVEEAGAGGRAGGHLWDSGLPGLNSGTGADTGGLSRGASSGGRFRGAGTWALRGLNSGSGALSPLLWHNPHAILRSPSAAVQGVKLLSALTPSAAFSLKVGVVAGSRTLTDVISSSGSAAILSSVALCGDGSLVAAVSGSPSAVGSGMRSAQRGDGGLGTGSGVEPARFSWEQAGNGDPFLARVHSTKVVKSARGPYSDNSALHAPSG